MDHDPIMGYQIFIMICYLLNKKEYFKEKVSE